MATSEGRKLFHAAHYNAVAKELREEFANQLASTLVPTGPRAIAIGTTSVVVNLALSFTHRFQLDNPNFDPLKFLDQCSPDTEAYPLSELWEEPNL
jgi:hypothetical protein